MPDFTLTTGDGSWVYQPNATAGGGCGGDICLPRNTDFPNNSVAIGSGFSLADLGASAGLALATVQLMGEWNCDTANGLDENLIYSLYTDDEEGYVLSDGTLHFGGAGSLDWTTFVGSAFDATGFTTDTPLGIVFVHVNSYENSVYGVRSLTLSVTYSNVPAVAARHPRLISVRNMGMSLS